MYIYYYSKSWHLFDSIHLFIQHLGLVFFAIIMSSMSIGHMAPSITAFASAKVAAYQVFVPPSLHFSSFLVFIGYDE